MAKPIPGKQVLFTKTKAGTAAPAVEPTPTNAAADKEGPLVPVINLRGICNHHIQRMHEDMAAPTPAAYFKFNPELHQTDSVDYQQFNAYLHTHADPNAIGDGIKSSMHEAFCIARTVFRDLFAKSIFHKADGPSKLKVSFQEFEAVLNKMTAMLSLNDSVVVFLPENHDTTNTITSDLAQYERRYSDLSVKPAPDWKACSRLCVVESFLFTDPVVMRVHNREPIGEWSLRYLGLAEDTADKHTYQVDYKLTADFNIYELH